MSLYLMRLDKFICTIKLHYWNNIGQIPHPLAVWHTQMLYTLNLLICNKHCTYCITS